MTQCLYFMIFFGEDFFYLCILRIANWMFTFALLFQKKILP